jgi:hypothetical protein
MVLTISDDDDGLAELLWVRAAWGLSPDGDPPPAAEGIAEPLPSVESLRRHKGEWERAWTELWAARLRHLGTQRDRGLFERMTAAPFGSDERRDLFDELRGPTWRDRFGDAAFDDRYDEWTSELSRRTVDQARSSLDEQPERVCLSALIPAWERGLTNVVLVPCSGDYTRTVGPNGLCVTRATRLDPDRYERALHSFGR